MMHFNCLVFSYWVGRHTPGGTGYIETTTQQSTQVICGTDFWAFHHGLFAIQIG